MVIDSLHLILKCFDGINIIKKKEAGLWQKGKIAATRPVAIYSLL